MRDEFDSLIKNDTWILVDRYIISGERSKLCAFALHRPSGVKCVDNK